MVDGKKVDELSSFNGVRDEEAANTQPSSVPSKLCTK